MNLTELYYDQSNIAVGDIVIVTGCIYKKDREHIGKEHQVMSKTLNPCHHYMNNQCCFDHRQSNLCYTKGYACNIRLITGDINDYSIEHKLCWLTWKKIRPEV